MGGAIPGLAVLGSITKQAEKAMVSKPIHGLCMSFLPPGSFLLEFLPSLLLMMDCLFYGTVSEINPFLPKLLLVMVFHHSNVSPD